MIPIPCIPDTKKKKYAKRRVIIAFPLKKSYYNSTPNSKGVR
jgi:hypothetical protein